MNAEMTVNRREKVLRQKNTVMEPAGLEIMNDCAGETSSNLID
jgi:hypothetical protein